jgi:hypothetical protein
MPWNYYRQHSQLSFVMNRCTNPTPDSKVYPNYCLLMAENKAIGRNLNLKTGAKKEKERFF